MWANRYLAGGGPPDEGVKANDLLSIWRTAALEGAQSFSGFVAWFRREENAENEVRLNGDDGFRKPSLEAVRKALSSFVGTLGDGDYANLRFSRVGPDGDPLSPATDGSFVLDKAGQPLMLHQMSDGEQVLLLTVDELRSALWRAQGGLCCYCQGPVADDSRNSKIEHYVPRSAEKGLDLDWANLWLSCMGGEGSAPARQHCDTRKGSHILQTNLDPATVVEEQFTYGAEGDIQHDVAAVDEEMKLRLNLNQDRLRENRKQATQALTKGIGRKTRGALTAGRLLKELEKLEQPSAKGLAPYVGALRFWLHRRLRRV